MKNTTTGGAASSKSKDLLKINKCLNDQDPLYLKHANDSLRLVKNHRECFSVQNI